MSAPAVLTSVDELFRRLAQHPDVIGLIGYGGDHRSENFAVGDIDLFVVTQSWQPEVESLHFTVAEVPIDLGLITLAALRDLEPAFGFPQLPLSEGWVLYDPTGEVGEAVAALRQRLGAERPAEPTAHSVAFLRHGHRHLLDKLRGRLRSEPLLARFLLGVNPYWLMENYFRVRRLPFRGEGHALHYWRAHEPELYRTLEAFYGTSDLDEQVRLTERLTDRVLEPVGGAWQPGEVLAFGTHESRDLAEQGERVYRELFYGDSG